MQAKIGLGPIAEAIWGKRYAHYTMATAVGAGGVDAADRVIVNAVVGVADLDEAVVREDHRLPRVLRLDRDARLGRSMHGEL